MSTARRAAVDPPPVHSEAELAERQIIAAVEGAPPAMRRAMAGYVTIASRCPAFASAWSRITKAQRFRLRHSQPLAAAIREAEKAAR